MAIEVYLFFDGDCREAVEFYAKVFNTEKPNFMTYEQGHKDNPNFQLPKEAKNRIMHTNISIKGTRMMFSDVFPGDPFTKGTNFTVALIDDDIDFIKTSFEKLKEGGQVKMELQETFWSKCYGMLTDKFGISWQFSHENKG